MAFELNPTLSRALSRLLIRLGSAPRKHQASGPIDLDDPIGGAVRDAELLVAFAAQSNRKVSTEKLTKLVQAAMQVSTERAAQRPLTPEQCANFWTAYDAVAVEMAPLSAHSIRTSLGLNANSALKSIPTHLGVNAWLALIVFFICVALQVFWVAGKDLVERSESLEKERAELQKKMVENAVAITRTELLIAAKCRTAHGRWLRDPPCSDSVSAAPIGVKPDAVRVAAMQAELDLLNGEISEKDLRGHEIWMSLQSIKAREKPVEILLGSWHTRAKRVCGLPYIGFICLSDDQPPVQTTSATLRSSLAEWRRTVEPAPSEGRVYLIANSRLADLDKRLTEGENFERMVVEIRLIVANIGTYLIAMAMGVLGALTFILRSTSQQLREHTYVPVSISMSMVRTCLGAIAGVFGSLLVPNGDATLKSLPPLVIPFVFGYAIEIVFSLMDRLVNNFTQATPSRQ